MTQENKKLLLRELCTRLPYGVIIHKHWEKKGTNEIVDVDKKLDLYDIDYLQHTLNEPEDYWYIIDFKPYLRSIESMTGEEERELEKTLQYTQYTLESYDWLNAHHFDYRWGYDEEHDMWRPLIELGLALPAPEGMYDN